MNETTENSFNEKSVYTFSGSIKHPHKIVPLSERLQITISSVEKTCRICLDTTESSSHFIHPCKCSGSVRYVHEECLKTWLVSLNKDLSESKCEICSTKYLMKINIKRKCQPQESCSAGLSHCLFIPILLAVKVMLLIIVYLLAEKYFNDKSTAEQKGYTIALTITCLIAEIIIIILIVNSIKEACYAARMQDWNILNQKFQDVVVDEEAVKRFEEIRTKTLVLPKKSKINGKNVRIPELRPLMTPIFRSGKVVAFSPKYLTPCHNRNDKTSIHELNDSELKDSKFKY